ncbi:endonuclease/exonuclease/phosphatase family protein [Christiangramia salexigens]|uniref:Endonuclease/exonuclease/phosphatase domain-containing protein n=1 Tax=Christiangramia salexigens TaxID=1913577 RepID=A0A1L3J3W8_9FLAO|nr:endonuclease/exonuclease/phosphatase family protein [Christiangramia salexigens]APG59821.1 hypothetical protein LPB144_05045 [Christiangramia salexigens]
MELTYYILTGIIVVCSLLPFVTDQHWAFRVWEFGRIQLLFLQLVVLGLAFLLIEEQDAIFWVLQALLMALIIYNIIILVPYTTLYKRNKTSEVKKHSRSISILSANVYQFNTNYHELLELIAEVDPDVVLTMESNKDWEQAMKGLEQDYPNFKKVGLENTYGMHFYTRLKTRKLKVNYFTADDLPSIEAELETEGGSKFTLFGVHPPPPSPTEEDNSKERDAELLSVARKVQETKGPVVVVGDFNNVAWAKSSILFRKTSELIDPRIGRGFVSTFHASYRLLRFPIDLFFHTTDIFIEEFKTLRHISSDHLPLFSKFYINYSEDIQEEEIESLEEGQHEEVDEMIEEGIKEESDRPEIATE